MGFFSFRVLCILFPFSPYFLHKEIEFERNKRELKNKQRESEGNKGARQKVQRERKGQIQGRDREKIGDETEKEYKRKRETGRNGEERKREK